MAIFDYEFRLFLEELCCDLCLFAHSFDGQPSPGQLRIDREFYLGDNGGFADIRVSPPGASSYFIEIKVGYPNDALLNRLRKKYGAASEAVRQASKLILVVDRERRPDWSEVQASIADSIAPHLAIEIWDEQQLLLLVKTHFGLEMPWLDEKTLLEVRQSIDRAKGYHAFGAPSLDEYQHDPLRAQLMWHLGFSRIKNLCTLRDVRNILPPGRYQGVVTVMADMCSFSSYVRDTPNDRVIRDALTAFYSKSRYEVINHGGMMYQFVGDEVIGLFGIPDERDNYIQEALQLREA